MVVSLFFSTFPLLLTRTLLSFVSFFWGGKRFCLCQSNLSSVYMAMIRVAMMVVGKEIDALNVLPAFSAQHCLFSSF
jgi:hypothetical protein